MFNVEYVMTNGGAVASSPPR